MDKNFNDEELSDIMKEIEALEEGFEEVSPVMQELSELDSKVAVPEKPAKEEASVISMAPRSSSKTATTSMSFKVSGDLNLDLQFEIDGKVICLEVAESGLRIQMEGGVTFSVPVKKAA